MTQTAAYEGKQTKAAPGTKTAAYAATSATTPIEPFEIERRAPRPNDVAIEILFCGVCHSDIHQARNEWGGSIFPMVPGHEIVGRVTSVGSAVKKFKAGRSRRRRLHGRLVPHCARTVATAKSSTATTRTRCTRTTDARRTGEPTYGGYSTSIVVDEASCSTSRTSSISRPPLPCSAPASPRTRRSSTGTSARARSSA